MKHPRDYREQYNALPYNRKQLALANLKRWGCWTKTTVYRKLAGESLSPIERVLIEGVLDTYTRRQDAEQLIIDFDWDAAQNSPKLSLKSAKLTTQKFGRSRKKH